MIQPRPTACSSVPVIVNTDILNTPGAAIPSRRAYWRLGILAAVITAAVIVALVVPLPAVADIRSFSERAGWLGAVAFVAGYGLITLTPVPKNVIGIAAGLTWGFGIGSLLVYLGALIGAGLAFLIGRALGREAVERITGARVARVDDLLRRRGLASIIGARLIPVLPFTAINYAASLTAVSRRDFALGTALGIIPGTLAYVAIGAFGFDAGPGLYIALGVLGALTLIGVLVAHRGRRRAAAEPESPDAASASAVPPDAAGATPDREGTAP